MSKDKITFPTGLITIVFINNFKYLDVEYGLIPAHLNLKTCWMCFILCVFLVDCLGVYCPERKEGSCFLLDLSECILQLPIQNSSQPSPTNCCVGIGGGR